MNTRRNSLITLAIAAALTLGGCPQPGGNGNTLPPVTLSTAQSAAIDSVARQLTAFGSLLATSSELADARLTVGSLPQLDVFGECPRVAIVASDDSAAIAFNFGDDGCSSDQTGGKTVTGGLDIRITRASGETTVTLLNLNIDGVAMTGAMQFTLTRSGTTVTLAGQITETVEIENVGSVSGSITLQVTTGGVITITTANLTLNDGTSAQAVTLDGLVIDPASNGNFVPQSGTASFSITEGDSTTALLVTFKSTTPSDGEVDVTVNSTGAATTTIPLP
jgi:hypothetical protein